MEFDNDLVVGKLRRWEKYLAAYRLPAWEQIPGLYVTGNMQGGRLAVEYPICCPGISHSMALTFGRIAGANCANGR